MVWVRTLDPHPKTHGKWNKQTLKPNYNLFLAKFQWFFSQQKLWVLFWEGEIRRSGGLEGEMLMKFGGEFRSFTPFGWGKGEDFGGSKNQMNIWSHLPWASPSFVPFYSNQLPSQIQLAIPQTIQLWDNQISAHLGRFTTFFASHLHAISPKSTPPGIGSPLMERTRCPPEASAWKNSFLEVVISTRNRSKTVALQGIPEKAHFFGGGNHLFSKTHAPERRGKGDGRAWASGILVGFR